MGHFLSFNASPPENPKNQNFEKNENKLLEISSSYKKNHIMYAYWDMEYDRQNFLSFWDSFWSFTSLTTQKTKMKNEKSTWRCHHFTHVYHKWQLWCMAPEIWSVTDIIFCHFEPFLPFYSTNNPKNQNLEKMKKTGDINILHKCIKNHDHMLHCSWDMVHDGCNCYFSFWAVFCPVIPLTAQKTEIKKKIKNTPEGIIILHMCTKKYDQMMYASWDIVCDRWTDRQMDNWMEKVTGALPKTK